MKKKNVPVPLCFLFFLGGLSFLPQACTREEKATEPFANHKIFGKITDIGNNPIKGIEIKAYREGDPEDAPSLETETDDKGEYTLQDAFAIPVTAVYTIRYTDIDGPENGEYEPSVETVTITESSLSGSLEDWFRGYFEKRIDLKLETK